MQHLNEHVIPVKTYFIVYLSLMVLLVVTVAVAFNNFGPFNLSIAMGVAVVKTVLIVLYFMHMKYSPKLIWLYAGAGFFWLFMLILLTMGDYLSRGWVPSIN
ncbi:MAG TPA: caa(3)-type oxidase subunit IV [Anaerolineae bacterium]|nr:caa(3)-type oxidase subunit IV [Anaerolineae bacterium]